MIPDLYIEQWRAFAPWKSLPMVEQDLIISRALIDLFNHPLVRESLVFRGGTALNKLYIDPPARYSEDIDLVQIKPEPIGKTLDAIREVLDPWLGEPQRKLTERSAKLVYRFTAFDNTPAKLKIEINTTEHFSVKPIIKKLHKIESEWFEGSANLLTYHLDELMATKLRALYQRRKGRDLFDLWYVLEKNLINIDEVIIIFHQYCRHNENFISQAMFEQNLLLKKQHTDFRSDMEQLLAHEVLRKRKSESGVFGKDAFGSILYVTI